MKKISIMNLKEATDLLRLAKQWGYHWSIPESRLRLPEIEMAFKVFWDSKPSEGEFSNIMGSVILTARILYYMATHSFTHPVIK